MEIDQIISTIVYALLNLKFLGFYDNKSSLYTHYRHSKGQLCQVYVPLRSFVVWFLSGCVGACILFHIWGWYYIMSTSEDQNMRKTISPNDSEATEKGKGRQSLGQKFNETNQAKALRKSHLVVEHPHGTCCSGFLKCLTVTCAPCRKDFYVGKEEDESGVPSRMEVRSEEERSDGWIEATAKLL